MSSPAEAERSDPELLAAHVDGDPDAFATLFRRHRDRLWAVALRTMGNPDDAADGLQDGMIAAYRRAGSFRGDAAVTTWLHRVVVNACLDRLRAAKVRRAEPAARGPRRRRRPRLAGHLDRRAPRTPPTSRSPTSAAGWSSPPWTGCPPSSGPRSCWWTWRATPSPRSPQMLDCAVGTVKSRCSRGRARLADLLGVLRPGAEPDHPPARNPVASSPVRSTEASRAPPDPG